jgi:uncharacterized protein YciI
MDHPRKAHLPAAGPLVTAASGGWATSLAIESSKSRGDTMTIVEQDPTTTSGLS